MIAKIKEWYRDFKFNMNRKKNTVKWCCKECGLKKVYSYDDRSFRFLKHTCENDCFKRRKNVRPSSLNIRSVPAIVKVDASLITVLFSRSKVVFERRA